MGGQLETVGERAGGLQLGEMVVEKQRQVAGFDGDDGFDGCDGSSDGSDGFDGFVGLVASSGVDCSERIWVLRASLTLMESQKNTNKFGKFLKTGAEKPTTPREATEMEYELKDDLG